MTKIFIDWTYTNTDNMVYNPEIIIDYTNSYTFSIGDLIREARMKNAVVKRQLAIIFKPFDIDLIIKLITNLYTHIEALSIEHANYANKKAIPFIYKTIIDIESESAEIFCFDMNRRVVDLK